MYIRAIQGHTGCMTILPASMVHILIPCDWKEFIFHKGCPDDSMSIIKNGLVAGVKESTEGRQSSSRLSNILEKIQMKKNPAKTFQNREKSTITETGNTTKMLKTGKMSRAQDLGFLSRHPMP